MARRRRAEELHWAIGVETYPWREREDQKNFLQFVDAMADTGKRRRTALEVVENDAIRIQMVGGAIRSHGEAWLSRNLYEAEFLASVGVTPHEAVARWETWHAAELQNAFWLVDDDNLPPEAI